MQNIPPAFPQLHIIRIEPPPTPLLRRRRTPPDPIAAGNIQRHRRVRLRWEGDTACFYHCMPEVSAAHGSSSNLP